LAPEGGGAGNVKILSFLVTVSRGVVGRVFAKRWLLKKPRWSFFRLEYLDSDV